jgi:hypothetical protein
MKCEEEEGKGSKRSTRLSKGFLMLGAIAARFCRERQSRLL